MALACAAPLRADESFTKTLSQEDFQAAGLGKLTPDELSRLDQLIRGQQSGAVAKAKEETTKSVSLMVRAQVQAEELKKQSAGIIEKMKVMLKPGTEIEYTTLDSAIVAIHEINFGKGGAVFTLANGQQWFTSEDDDWPSTKAGPIRARVVPGSMGSFFLDIERGGRPRVRFVGNVAPAEAQPAAAH